MFNKNKKPTPAHQSKDNQQGPNEKKAINPSASEVPKQDKTANGKK